MSDHLQPHGLQHTRLLYSQLSPRDFSNSCLLSQCCCLTISFSVFPFSFCLQSFPASGSFPTSQLFASRDQSVGVSVFPMNIHGWFPLGVSGLISLQSKKLSRVLSSTTIRKNQFFSAQPSLWSSSHTPSIHLLMGEATKSQCKKCVNKNERNYCGHLCKQSISISFLGVMFLKAQSKLHRITKEINYRVIQLSNY